MRHCVAFAASFFLTVTTCIPQLHLDHGGIVRTDTSKKEISLVFTGHEFGEGGETIRKVLRSLDVKASFFFTGDFYRNPEFSTLIDHLRSDGHYLGGHSDKHLLYASWGKRESLLVTRNEFIDDIAANYAAMEQHGIRRADARYFLPPFEWYNDSISQWCAEQGLALVNFTPGTYSNADWTYPDLGDRYVGSDEIYRRILQYEEHSPYGLNGFILLMHIGTDPRRTDKFYVRLESLIVELKKRGYRFIFLSDGVQ